MYILNKNLIVVGAGIVGLASAYQIQKRNPELKITVIEKENGVAKHQTGNNSGVIHSGIYYKPGSLKAQNCRTGYKMLIDFCNENEIKYDLCGKVIVATSNAEIPYLETILEKGNANGLENLKVLSAGELNELEPFVNGVKGIHVPQTGIINYTEVSEKLAELIIKAGGEIIFDQEVQSIKKNGSKVEVFTNSNFFSADYLVTCAGLQSDRIAKMTHPELPLRIVPFRGEYYKLKEDKKHFVNNLIYPVPDPAFPFLGVHFTRMINGDVECGPNAVFSFKREGYTKTSFNLKDTFESFAWPGFQKVAAKYWKTGFGEFYRSFSKNAFVQALNKLIPEIKEEDLISGGAGVRAQASDKTGGLVDDFYIVESERIIHVCNAPSPAATSSLSIGNHIADKLIQQIN